MIASEAARLIAAHCSTSSPAARGREHREVGRGAVGVDVGEAAEHAPLLAARLAHGLLARPRSPLVEGGEALPRDRRLEGLGEHAHRDEHVAQVGRAEERVRARS